MELPPNIDPELPWGYWLRMTADYQGPSFVDDLGNHWRSVRDAFWTGRLGMPKVTAQVQSEILETMLAALINKTRSASTREEYPIEIFDGSRPFSIVFDLWLQREALITPCTGGSPWSEAITAEGASVMLMLAATRPQQVRSVRPTSLSVRNLVELGIGPHPAEDRMREVEAATVNMPAAFRRHMIAAKHVIILEKRDVYAPVPVVRTVWTQRFANRQARDALYEWLCQRIDRWEQWAELAWSDSGAALTAHLLSQAVVGHERNSLSGLLPPQP